MMPALVDQPPEGKDWQHEIKYDGYRTQLVIEGADVRAFTRNGYDWTGKYSGIVRAAGEIRCSSAVLDGEVIVQDHEGRSNFHAIKDALARRSEDFVFMAFDLLHLNGRDLRREPLRERRLALQELVGSSDARSVIRFSDHVVGTGRALLEAADKMGLEGIVSKKMSSRYRSGPSKSWLKIKCFGEDEFTVIGTSRGDRAPVALLARETPSGLEYAGAAMVTLPDTERETFWRTNERLKVPEPAIPMPHKAETSWLRPEMKVRAQFLRGEAMLRHATVKSLTSTGPVAKRPRTLRQAPTPEPSYPKPHIASEQLLEYYRQLGPLMLQWAASRPLNLFRCPGSDCFFQRNGNHPPTPEGTFATEIHQLPIEQKNGRTEDYLWIDDLPGVLACVAAKTVEFHGWGSRVEDVERPDRLVIDLDPDEGVGFAAVKEAALDLRRHLLAVGLESFPLLTGGKGIHVVVPLTPSTDWAEVRGFAKRFCTVLAEAQPDRFTVSLPKAQRKGRIFLDFLRNQRTATAIMPYSARARHGLPVAAPLAWSEVPRIKSASCFSINDASELIERAGGRRLRGWGRTHQTLPRLE
ncbi:MAG: DNA ligase D [Pseudomonadota bacterium]|nr:DNA ligase D [Pseudomonadota bacterium]